MAMHPKAYIQHSVGINMISACLPTSTGTWSCNSLLRIQTTALSVRRKKQLRTLGVEFALLQPLHPTINGRGCTFSPFAHKSANTPQHRNGFEQSAQSFKSPEACAHHPGPDTCSIVSLLLDLSSADAAAATIETPFSVVRSSLSSSHTHAYTFLRAVKGHRK